MEYNILEGLDDNQSNSNTSLPEKTNVEFDQPTKDYNILEGLEEITPQDKLKNHYHNLN